MDLWMFTIFEKIVFLLFCLLWKQANEKNEIKALLSIFSDKINNLNYWLLFHHCTIFVIRSSDIKFFIFNFPQMHENSQSANDLIIFKIHQTSF